MYPEKLSEGLAVVSCIDPDEYSSSSTTNGDVIDMAKFNRVLFVVMAGTLGSSATVNYKIYGDTDSGGSFTTQLTGKAITPLTQAGGDADKQAIIEVTAEEVQAQGFRYIQDELTVATAACDVGAIALASCARYHPAAEEDNLTGDQDLDSVDEIVS